MKKLLTLLTVMVCAICFSACASSSAKEFNPQVSEEQAIASADSLIELMSMATQEEAIRAQYSNDPLFASAMESWMNASTDMGDFVGITGHQVNFPNEKEVIILVDIQGSVRNAQVELIIKDDYFDSITTNVQYTFAEQMQKAGLNTLLGMGTVFTVLILISLIISLFVHIPKLQEAFSKKNAPAPAPAPKPAARPEASKSAPTPPPAPKKAEKPEPKTDELAVIAAIAAAISAFEGGKAVYFADGAHRVDPADPSDTGDYYIVRSIRRVSGRK